MIRFLPFGYKTTIPAAYSINRYITSYKDFVDLLNKVTPSFCDVRDFNYNCMSEIFSNHIVFCSKSDQNYFENSHD